MSTASEKNRAGRRTAERLLDAAERLVATSGPTVPLRQITRAAGQKNNSAITYHFGSRQGLIDAVWVRRTQRVNRERAALLESMEADGSIDDLHALVEAHVLPFAHEMAENLPSYWARFNEVALAQMPLSFLDTFDADLARRV
uniref:TetR/AcrR family transcriptional regulator n=1 Tax=Pseudactinotalea sp. TaxID=1926260 RepID=UPI003B3B9DBC